MHFESYEVYSQKKFLDMKENGFGKALQIVLHYALYALLEVVKQDHLVKQF